MFCVCYKYRLRLLLLQLLFLSNKKYYVYMGVKFYEHQEYQSSFPRLRICWHRNFLMQLFHFVVKDFTQILQQQPEYELYLPAVFPCTKSPCFGYCTNILAKSFPCINCQSSAEVREQKLMSL